MAKTKRNHRLVLLIGLLILSYFPLFLHLDTLPLRIYDESRLAISALEMTETGNLLVPSYENKPDMWNVKPPLMIWLQAGCMKILGYKVLAVRLPSALFGLFCVLFLYWFCYNVLKSSLLGFIASLVLLCTPGFISNHVTRTGEYDAMLCFFMLAYAFFFFRHLHDKDQKSPKYLYYSGFFFVLAVFTKGIAGFLFLPGLFLYALLKKKVSTLFQSRPIYFLIFGATTLILAYYLGRESINPGYLQAVWDNELGGRYTTVLENNGGKSLYYCKKLYLEKFTPWIWWLPISVGIVLIVQKNRLLREITILCLVLALSFILIISNAQTKLAWYLAPALPLLSLVCGIGIYSLFRMILNGLEDFSKFKKIILSVLLVFSLFYIPYARIIKEVYLPQDKEWNRRKMLYGPFLDRLQNTKGYYVTHRGYNSHLGFHVKAHEKKGKPIIVIDPKGNDIPVGSKVIICEEKMNRPFIKQHQFKILDQYQECQLVEVTGLHSPDT